MVSARPLLLLPFLLAPALAEASPAATRAFNQEVQQVWDRLRPAGEVELRRQVQAQVGPLVRQKKLEIDLRSVRRVDIYIGVAPGLTRIDRAGIALRVPASGTWRVVVEGEVELRFRFLGRWRKSRIPVRVDLRKLCVEAGAAFDWRDPSRPKVARVGKPKVRFKVRLRAPGTLFKDVLLRALTPIGNIIAKKAVKKALETLTPQLETFKNALPGPVHAENAPLLADSGRQAPVSATVAGVDAKIRAIHLPHGIIHPMGMGVPNYETWEQAYGPNGVGNPGTPQAHGDGGDSSAWNAHYIASQAFRHAVTRDPAALDNVRLCLRAYGDMLRMHGDTGLMARVAAPTQSEMGAAIQRYNDPQWVVRGTIRGQPWVATNGNHGDSRDVYIEIVFGLAAVHDLIADPQVRAEAARCLTLMIGYLVKNEFIIDEDRPKFDASQPNDGFPSFWLGVPIQKITMLLVAAQLDARRFAPELARWSPLSELAWLSQWSGTFSLDDYFGFNLAGVAYYTYFRRETDPRRWQDVMRAYRIYRRYIGHHQNAYFDAIHLSIDPSDTAYRGSVREALRRFIKRPHRKVAPLNLDLTQVQWTTVTFPISANNPTKPGAGQTHSVRLPTAPLSTELRHPEHDFIWQRTPFKPYAGPGQGEPLTESTGLDLVAPYWMARYLGVQFP